MDESQPAPGSLADAVKRHQRRSLVLTALVTVVVAGSVVAYGYYGISELGRARSAAGQKQAELQLAQTKLNTAEAVYRRHNGENVAQLTTALVAKQSELANTQEQLAEVSQRFDALKQQQASDKAQFQSQLAAKDSALLAAQAHVNALTQQIVTLRKTGGNNPAAAAPNPELLQLRRQVNGLTQRLQRCPG